MKSARLKKGFSLVELLVVIAVIGVLASIMVVAINPVTQLNKANDAKRKTDLTEIQKALEVYYQDNQAYPASLAFGQPFTPYMARLPNDPSSSKRYVYRTVTGQEYYLFASLDNWQSDQQACVPNTNTRCTNQTSGSCGSGICNYGKSSPNVTPH